jgi:hypothetical protein
LLPDFFAIVRSLQLLKLPVTGSPPPTQLRLTINVTASETQIPPPQPLLPQLVRKTERDGNPARSVIDVPDYP